MYNVIIRALVVIGIVGLTLVHMGIMPDGIDSGDFAMLVAVGAILCAQVNDKNLLLLLAHLGVTADYTDD